MRYSMVSRRIVKSKTCISNCISELSEVLRQIDNRAAANNTADCLLLALETMKTAEKQLTDANGQVPQ